MNVQIRGVPDSAQASPHLLGDPHTPGAEVRYWSSINSNVAGMKAASKLSGRGYGETHPFEDVIRETELRKPENAVKHAFPKLNCVLTMPILSKYYTECRTIRKGCEEP